GKWEFPGGKVEAEEDPILALEREIREELGLDIAVGPLLGTGRDEHAERVIKLDVHLAALLGGEITLLEHAAVRWIDGAAIDTLDWAPADRPLLPALRRHLR